MADPRQFIRLLSHLPRPARADGRRTVAVLPPTDITGSLGDEAMARALVQEVRRAVDEIRFLMLKRGVRWLDDEPGVGVLPARRALKPRTVLPLVRLALRLRRSTHFCILGADMMDGFYDEQRTLRILELADLSSALGLTTAIVGFSFNGHPPRAVVERFRRLPRSVQFAVRDPVSHRRLETLAGRAARLTADLSFLLEPHPRPVGGWRATEWIQQQRSEGRAIIGVNLNSVPFGENLEQACESFAAVLQRVRVNGTEPALLLMPHDYRGEHNDLHLLRTLRGKWPASMDRRAMLIDASLGSREAKSLCAEMDLLLSSRMHLAIAALSQGVPALCVDYQGKVEGLYEHLGAPELRLPPDAALDAVELAARLRVLVEERRKIRQRLVDRLPAIRLLARRNLDFLGLQPRMVHG